MFRHRFSTLIMSHMIAGVLVTPALAITIDSSITDALADKATGDVWSINWINAADVSALVITP